MTEKNRKELLEQYKTRTIVGGICAIVNRVTGERFISLQTDIAAYQNRFVFSQKTGSCVEMKIQRSWREYGAEAFALEILETLEKKEDQSASDFKADLELLLEIELEKLE